VRRGGMSDASRKVFQEIQELHLTSLHSLLPRETQNDPLFSVHIIFREQRKNRIVSQFDEA
jgi:hypothetical protein